MSQHIVIVGGGVTGLSAARVLKEMAEQQHLDLRCTVLEQDRRLGGKIRTNREDGLIMEAGPDSMLARKPAGVNLIRALGIESETVDMPPAAGKTYILHQGRLHRIPPGTNMGIPTQIRPFAATPLLSAKGKSRALLDLVLPRSADAKAMSSNTDESLGGFLRRRLGDEVVERIAEPLLAGIYAGSIDDLSLLATFPQFRTLEVQHRSLILGTMAQKAGRPPHGRHRPGRAGANAAEVRPSLQGASAAASKDSSRSAFVTLRGGLQTLIERLYDVLYEWVDLRMATTVTRIDRDPTGGYVISLAGASEEQLRADAVIVTAPASAASRMLSTVTPKAQSLASIPYVSTATVMLGYRTDTLKKPLDGSGFVIPRREQRFITACTWVSNKWPHTATEGISLVRCYVGRAGQQDTLQQSDSEIVQAVQLELRDILGINVPPAFSKVTRWDHSMPQYLVGHLDKVNEVEQALAMDAPGVYLAGAGYHGVGIPDCIADGEQRARQALDFLASP